MRHLYVPTLLTLLLWASGCDKVKKAAETAENGIFAEPEYTAVEGDKDLGKYLQPVPGAAPFDPAALLKAMDVGGPEQSKAALALAGYDLTADAGGDVQSVDGDTIDFLTGGSDSKDNMDSSAFKQTPVPALPQKTASGLDLADDAIPAIDPNFDPLKDTADLTIFGDKSEIIISTIDKVSVKDQGQRGTCAANAGAGFLDYMIMKKHGAELSSVEVSRQRFYMLSKSDLWEKGGGVTDQDSGSAWEQGFNMSAGTDGKAPPTDAAHEPYNIPLDADCPYSKDPGANELQIPQAQTCLRGAVKVTGVTQSYSVSVNGGPFVPHSNGVVTANDMLKFLKNYDLPIPVGTTLSKNWMDNDGMITFAKSQEPGFGPHAGGHAYLVVGARKLDESKYPGEGGLCFVIKNSWGTGWGQQGFSCMTLAWFNHNRHPDPFDVALDVQVDLDYLKAHMTGTVPAALPAPAPAAPPAPATPPAVEPAVAATPTPPPPAPAPGPAVPNIADSNGVTPAPAPGPAPAPAPATPATTADGFTVGRLALRDGRLMQVLFKNSASSFVMRGVFAGQTAATQDLTLGSDGTTIFLDDQKRNKTHIAAGTVTGDIVTLCSGKYGLTCDLHLVKEENRFAIGISEAEFRNYEADPKADYKTLVDFQKYGIQYAINGIYTDLKLIVGGTPTNPIRLAVKPVSGSIMFRGQEIGNYQKLMMCSGDYDALCRILVNQNDHSLKVFFKAKKPKP